MAMHVLGELMLAGVCLWAAWCSAALQQPWRVCGFLLMVIGAMTGALEYAGISGAQPWHLLAVHGSSRWSLPLIAIGALAGWRLNALLLGIAALFWALPDSLALGSNLVALLVIGWYGRSQRWPLAFAGCALFVLSGLWIAGPGAWLGIPRVDLYHLGLTLAVGYWLGAGLRIARSAPRPSLNPSF